MRPLFLKQSNSYPGCKLFWHLCLTPCFSICVLLVWSSACPCACKLHSVLHVIKEETSRVKGATLQSVCCAGKGCLFTDKLLVWLILLEPLLRNVSELSRAENGSGANISRRTNLGIWGSFQPGHCRKVKAGCWLASFPKNLTKEVTFF